MSPNFAIVDIETTGGSIKNASITEIAIALFDGEKIIDSFQSLVRPQQTIPPFITQLTGITNEMVQDAPFFYEIAKEIVEITEDAIFVAHNVNFDYSFIRAAFEDLGYTYTRKKLCTAKLARKLLPELPRHNLDTLIQHYGLSVENRHRAMDDVEATVHVLGDLLKKKDSDTTLKEFINHGIKATQLPPKLTLSDLHALPEECGVYYIYAENDLLLYVGKSVNIRQRLFQHFRSHGQRSMKFLAHAARIEHELTGSEIMALIQEDKAIKKHHPEFNIALKQKEEKYAIIKGRRGYMPEVVLTKRITPTDEVWAYYPKKTSAKNHLDSCLVDTKLCSCRLSAQIPGMACDHPCMYDTLHDDLYQPSEMEGLLRQKIRNEFDHDFVVLDRGRKPEEKSFFRVINGNVAGCGYLDGSFGEYQPSDLEEAEEALSFSSYYNKVVSHHLLKKKANCEVVPLNPH